MNTHDTEATAVLRALKDSLDGVTMHTRVDQIVTAGRTRRRRRRLMGTATGVAAVTGLALGVPALSHPSTAPLGARLSTGAGSVHIRTAAFTVDSHTDGTVHVTWDKKRYFQDHEGLQRALRKARFPVLIKEGVLCKGPQDDGYLNPSGVGRGVDRVMKGERRGEDTVVFVFKPSAMPAGKQLFIGYLSPSQLAVTHGRPGSVERLVSTGVPLTCTSQVPPPNQTKNGPVTHRG
jgi:hypothetical protein